MNHLIPPSNDLSCVVADSKEISNPSDDLIVEDICNDLCITAAMYRHLLVSFQSLCLVLFFD
jgi:hypothetical protein